jgi:hypothetical protein
MCTRSAQPSTYRSKITKHYREKGDKYMSLLFLVWKWVSGYNAEKDQLVMDSHYISVF